MKNKLEFITNQLKEIDQYCKNNDHMEYWELYEKIEEKFDRVQSYAKQNDIPFKANIYDILDKYVTDEQEESSSYYEEDESSHYEEDEEQ